MNAPSCLCELEFREEGGSEEAGWLEGGHLRDELSLASSAGGSPVLYIVTSFLLQIELEICRKE